MKKRSLYILIALVLCLTATLFCACSLLGDNSDNKSGDNAPKEYTISLHDVKDGELSAKDFYNDRFELVEPSKIPTKDGYTFVKWCSDADCTTELEYGKVISSSLHIYPLWKINTYVITFEDDKKLVSETEQEVDYLNKVVLPDPVAAGYSFIGWFTDKECTEAFDEKTEVTEAFTLYAKWEEVRYAIHYYTNGGQTAAASETYTRFASVTLPACEKDGYVFMGWYDNPSFAGKVYTAIATGESGEKSFYAKFLCASVSVTAKNASAVIDGKAITVPASYRGGVVNLDTFLAFGEGATWSLKKKGGATVDTVTLAENGGDDPISHEYILTVTSESETETKEYDLTVKQFTSKEINVTYYLAKDKAQEYKTDVVTSGEHATEPAEPTAPTGYSFECWYEESDDTVAFDFDTAVGTEDIVLIAKFAPITYAVTYSLGYGTCAEELAAVYTVEDEITLPQATPKNADEYKFDGWYDKNMANKYEKIVLGTTGDIDLYAVYSLKAKSVTAFDSTTIAKEKLVDYLTYMIYNRIEEAFIKVTGATEGDAFDDYFKEVYPSVDVDGIENVTASYVMAIADEDGVWQTGDPTKALISMTYSPFAKDDSRSNGFVQTDFAAPHASATGRDEEYGDFAIDHILDTLVATDSEQLVYAVEHGYRPLPTVGSAAERLYKKAKDILREIIDDGMSDEEKALAIYDYIILNNEYDHAVFDDVTQGIVTAEESRGFKSFYLEGILDNKLAVCDGISKAYMLLCRIEGIRALQCEGTAVSGNSGHAWNKIYIKVGDKAAAWYVVDCTSGDVALGTAEMLTHTNFLITDEKMGTRYTETKPTPEAKTAYNYYENFGFTVEETDYTFAVGDETSMNAFFRYLVSKVPQQGDVSMEVYFVDDYTCFNDQNLLVASVFSGIDMSKYSIRISVFDDGAVISFILANAQ